MEIKEVKPSEDIIEELIKHSKLWVKENISHGIVEDTREDIIDKRIFVVTIDDKVVASALAHKAKAKIKNISSVIPDDEDILEIDTIYVLTEYRSKGLGKALFKYIEDHAEANNIVLATSTKDYKKVMHFYIDEIGMDFHSALLYKKLK